MKREMIMRTRMERREARNGFWVQVTQELLMLVAPSGQTLQLTESSLLKP